MIRTIQSIKSFGIFTDFLWPAGLPEFKQFNLIYGWNYSGKTTLSRVFRCFEQKQPHEDFAGAQVQLKTDDGVVHKLSVPDTAPVFRVFNSDFISEHLGFESGSATPVLVLGAEDIAKQCPGQVFEMKGSNLAINQDNIMKAHLCDSCVAMADPAGSIEIKDTEDIVFYVEGWGQLSGKEMVLTALEEYKSDLDAFEKQLK